MVATARACSGELLLLLAALLAGCQGGVSTGERPQSRYQGAPVELFFAQWGAPVSSHRFGSDWTMYLWYSGRHSAYVPGHADSELIGNTAWWLGYPLPTFEPREECGVRLVVAPDGFLQEILVHNDAIGWWQRPRCRRIFGPPVRPAY